MLGCLAVARDHTFEEFAVTRLGSDKMVGSLTSLGIRSAFPYFFPCRG